MSNLPIAGDITGTAPRYIRIAEHLIAQIEAGLLRPGDKLPPERELSQQLGVNRMTLRQALQILDSQGLLTRRQGDGTYIAAPKIERAADRFFPFSQGMRSRGYAPSATMLGFEELRADVSVAAQLGLLPQTVIYAIQRLRLLNGEPVMLEKTSLPAERFPGLQRFDLASHSIYEIMSQEYGVVLRRARQILEPVVATAYEAALLGVSPGAPLMLERRQTYDDAGQAVEYTKDLYRGDRFRFITEHAPVDD
jgi:GntR family transcriptional regulator